MCNTRATALGSIGLTLGYGFCLWRGESDRIVCQVQALLGFTNRLHVLGLAVTHVCVCVCVCVRTALIFLTRKREKKRCQF